MYNYSEYYKKNTSPEIINLNFIKWIDQVEKMIYKKLKLNLLDIPDQLYMYHFENGYTPKDMFDLIIEETLYY